MNKPENRRGITLLEVLISIGILAIGLSSVAALITAARSQASRAVVLDRAAVLAANAVADAATFGLMLDGALTVSQTSGVPIVIDPAGSLTLPSSSNANIRAAGLFSTPSINAAPAWVQRLFCESRDDVVVAPGASEDDPPTNLLIDGIPAYEGKMTALMCVTPPAAAGEPGRVSVVVFYGRDPTQLAVTGTLANGTLMISGTSFGGRTLREVVKPGVVFWGQSGQRFHQADAAAIDSSGTSALLTLSTGALLTGTQSVQILPDSVGLAERPYFPETAGPYTR